MKKILSLVLALAMIMSCAVFASAAETTQPDLDCTGWWAAHSEGIELTEEGFTVTFTSTTYADAANNWNGPLYVLYTNDVPAIGELGVGSYAEYWVQRVDNYGWVGAVNRWSGDEALAGAGITYAVDETNADWDNFLANMKTGINCTVTAKLEDGKAVVVMDANGVVSTVSAVVDTTKPVYLSLSGELCTLTDIVVTTPDAEAPEFEGDGTEENPWIIDSLPYVIENTFGPEYEIGHFYNVTIAEAGTVYVESFSGCSVAFMVNGEWGYIEPFTVAAGDVVTIAPWAYSAGAYSISLGFTPGEPDEGGDEGGDVEIDLELELGENNLVIESYETMSPLFTFTPEDDGMLTLDVVSLKSIYYDQITYYTEQEIAELLESYGIGLQVDGYDYLEPVAVTAGTPVIITMTQSRVYSMYGYAWEAVLNLSMGGDEGGEEPEPEPIYEGDFVAETTDTYGYFDQINFTAPVTGTYTFYIPAGLGIWSLEAYNSWAQPEIDFYDNTEGFALVMDLAEGEGFSFYIGATTKKAWTISYVVTEADEGGEEPGPGTEQPDVTELPLNSNISITPGMSVVYQHTATRSETLTLQTFGIVGGEVSVLVKLNNGAAVAMAANEELVFELIPGDVVTVTIEASGYSTLRATTATEGGEDPDPEPKPEPDGTHDAPYIIDELPYEGTQEETDDWYYQWTATADGILYVYTSGGCSMVGSSVSGWEYLEDGNGKYIEVAAGDVITINVWYATSFTVEFVSAGGEDPEVLVGDANGDGDIDYLDAMLVAQFYVGDISEEGMDVAAADANGDGDIDYLDAMLIAQYYVGDIDSFNP